METVTFKKQDVDCSVDEVDLAKTLMNQLRKYVASNSGRIAKGSISLTERDIHIEEEVDDEET